MRTTICLALTLTLGVAAALGQSNGSPYAGQEKQPIRALSEGEIAAYLDGQGMGLAKAAELNEYPGPKHVLEMTEQLQLSEAQKSDTQKVYDRMRGEATRLGKLIVDMETHLDSLFASKSVDSKKLRAMTAEIARLQGELRAVHLDAHIAMRHLLTQQQVEKYVALRGYGRTDQPDPNKGHKH
ncbi:MAG TPA: Spy/CpxP family protein refolding chaperone [Blastocatellia bacterium]|nr:Spy/CpxP family protein refolding chaperone [Blastocatellia bacterium]